MDPRELTNQKPSVALIPKTPSEIQKLASGLPIAHIPKSIGELRA